MSAGSEKNKKTKTRKEPTGWEKQALRTPKKIGTIQILLRASGRFPTPSHPSFLSKFPEFSEIWGEGASSYTLLLVIPMLSGLVLSGVCVVISSATDRALGQGHWTEPKALI